MNIPKIVDSLIGISNNVLERQPGTLVFIQDDGINDHLNENTVGFTACYSGVSKVKMDALYLRLVEYHSSYFDISDYGMGVCNVVVEFNKAINKKSA